MFRKQEDIQQDRQADSRTGGHETANWVFHQAAESEWLDIVEVSAPTQTEEEPTSGLRAVAVGAPAPSGYSPSKQKKWWHTDTLLGTSSEDEAWQPK
jgi:hypothetical protein